MCLQSLKSSDPKSDGVLAVADSNTVENILQHSATTPFDFESEH